MRKEKSAVKYNFTGCSAGLQQCRCFETLNEDEVKLLEANSVVAEYKKGEIICRRGTFASNIMFLESGLAKIFLEDGVNTLVLKILPEKNLIGLASLSEDMRTFEYSAMTYVKSIVRQIDISTFRRLLELNPKFAREVINIQNANSVQIYSRFFCLTHKQSYGRLADIIMCLSDRVFRNEEFELPLSRKDIADLTGLSPETVIRMLKVFREEGIIAMDGKRMTVLNADKMRQISETG